MWAEASAETLVGEWVVGEWVGEWVGGSVGRWVGGSVGVTLVVFLTKDGIVPEGVVCVRLAEAWRLKAVDDGASPVECAHPLLDLERRGRSAAHH